MVQLNISHFLDNTILGQMLIAKPLSFQDRIPGEPFLPKSSKDAEMEKILRSMEVPNF